MNTGEFIKQVQNRTGIASRDTAVRAIRATLETLGQRLYGGESEDLAAQLPKELGSYLKEKHLRETFSLSEFFERVSRNEETGIEQAEAHARAVIEVLCEAVSEGEIEDVRSQLPEDFAALFCKGGRTIH